MVNNGLVTIKNVRGYIGENEVAFLNLEDVARGLGFAKKEIKNGKEYKRWNKQIVKNWLIDFGILNSENILPEFIPENIFYKLCMKANNEVARKFQDLVCDEILPSIRKNGGYIVSSENDSDEEIIARALIIAQKTIEKKNKEIKKLENINTHLKVENETQKQVIEEFKPVKEYLDVILASDDTLCITQIAADYGLSGVELNKILNKEGVIRKINGQWLLYKEHMNKGYTQSHTYNISTIIGERIAITTRWTQKGRLKIHEILTGLGIKANMDKEKELS